MLGLNGEGGNKTGEKKRGGRECRVESWTEKDEASTCWRMWNEKMRCWYERRSLRWRGRRRRGTPGY